MNAREVLTATDIKRLTLFKWKYRLESAGFTSEQAQYLLFIRWLHNMGRI